MNGFRIVIGTITGATVTGLMLAIASYFATISSNDGGMMGPEREWWILTVPMGLIFGIILGGLSGTVITSLSMNPLKAALFGGGLNLLVVVVFYFVTNGMMSDAIKYSIYSLIPIGLINGVLVSFSFSSRTPVPLD